MSAISRVKNTSTRSALSKEDVASLIKAGMTQRDSSRFHEARDIFSSLRDLCPTEPHGELGLGATCFSEGRFDDAICHYRQALKLSPCNAYAYALLGESQIFRGERSAARVSLRRAFEIDCKGPYGRLAQELLIFLDSLPMDTLTEQDRQL
jgi:Flp pilus assembly protein TadD